MEHLHRENKEIDVITLPEELNRMKKWTTSAESAMS